jgi:hypothetical protein
MSARYHFIPWARQGAATAVPTVETLDATLPAQVRLSVTVQVNARHDVPMTVRLYGPGDVTGIDRRQIIRTDPPHRATNFEPNYFPAVEFDRPDFPWLFTPAAATAEGQLRPWLCLVVVRRQAGVHLASAPGRPLPVLTIEPPARPGEELPDLTDSWAWAHTQVVTSDGGPSMAELLATNATQALSRLLAPRRLEAGVAYLACLVPAFEVGRQAGLGLSVTAPDEQTDEQTLAPSWRAGDDAPPTVTLPVYYHWEFSTGVGGDFKSLARVLTGRPVPEGVGTREMAVDQLGFRLPDLGVLPFGGALRAPPPPPQGGVPIRPRDALPTAFTDAFRDLLNLPEARTVDEDPIVVPPIYGQRQASLPTVPEAAPTPSWLRDLNLDPRHRAAAGLGVLVVQDQQEQLMASAWEQMGGLASQPRPFQAWQAAQAVLLAVYTKRLVPQPPDRLLQITGQAHARLALAGIHSFPLQTGTLSQLVRQSWLPETVVAAPFRRVTRSQGPVARKLTVALTPSRGGVPLIRKLAVGPTTDVVLAQQPLPWQVTPAVTAGQVEHVRRAYAATLVAMTPNPQISRLLQATEALQAYYTHPTAVPTPATPALQPLPLTAVKSALLTELHPQKTIPAQVAARLKWPEEGAGTRLGDSLELPLPVPSFPQPMYEALKPLSQDFLLPGVEQIPPDSVLLLETNPPFIEAFLVGLNHEMGRELLWREYPTELRLTYFQRFWDTPGSGNGPTAVQIPAIHLWAADTGLGQHFMNGQAEGQLTLLIRGELLRRYPNTVVYAVEATPDHKLGDRQVHPSFRGVLEPDITILGFALTTAQVRSGPGNPGWFIVIEQPPTEARFGLDVATAFGRDLDALTSWDQLSWGDLVADEAEFQRLTYVPVHGRLDRKKLHVATGELAGEATWRLNGGHMAAVTLQRPVRIARHADKLLPPKTGEEA